MTTVVNLRKSKYDIYCGRGSKWGNPYKIPQDGNRKEVIEKYREYLKTRPDLVEAARTELKDKVLGCYCFPLPCHGNILARIANDY